MTIDEARSLVGRTFERDGERRTVTAAHEFNGHVVVSFDQCVPVSYSADRFALWHSGSNRGDAMTSDELCHAAAEKIADFEQAAYGVISPGYAGPSKNGEIQKIAAILRETFGPTLDRLAAENERLVRARDMLKAAIEIHVQNAAEWKSLNSALEQQVAALRSAAEEALSELRAVDDHSSTGNASVRKAISRLSAAISGKTE